MEILLTELTLLYKSYMVISTDVFVVFAFFFFFGQKSIHLIKVIIRKLSLLI